MLSIKWITGVDYYLKKKKRRRASDADDSDDPDESGDASGLGYYFDIGEGDGEWWGSGAAALGLLGPVRAEDLKALCQGFSPDGTPLIQNAGGLDHQQAWDLTYSAPKSLSVLWSQLDQTLRIEIQNLHRRAINAALGYLAEVAVITRRGKGGSVLEPALPIVAIFADTTSRELEPQLHSHCLLLNVAGRMDSTFGTILSQPFYRHKLTAGAIYQTELAYLLRSELGLRIEKDKVAFRVAGVPEKLVDHYSTRSKQVRQKLQSKGYHSAKAAAVAALDTRKAKPESPPSFSELLRQWQSTNEKFGFTQAAAIRLIGKAGPELNLQTLEQRLVASMRELLKNESFFSEQELIRQISQAVMAEGIATSDLINIVRAFLTTNPELVPLEGPRHDPRFTTHEILAIERELLATIDQGRTNASHIVKDYIVDRILDDKLPLHADLTDDERIRNSEQRNAIRKVTSSHGDVQVIEGMAGTGKTYTLNVARQIWSKAGFRVLGMALSSAAAANLEAGANIPSDTIAMRLSQLSFDLASHHKQQFKRLLTGKRTYAYRGSRLHLNRKTIVVVDEAGMVDTRQFAEIVRLVKNARAKLVLIGDRRQLQPIEAGGPFAAVADRTEKAELKHVVRQRIEPDDPNPTWHREAGKLIASGHVAQAIKLFSERGRLSVLDERDQAMLSLVRDWTVGGITNPTDHIVLAATREEVDVLNGMCQAARFTAGAIGTEGVQIGEHSIHLGDIVLFTRNQRIIGVNNGDRGRVLGFNPLTRNMAVQLERTKRTVFIPYRNYTHVQLGYAMTTHKAQGATVPSVYVLLGGSMQNCHLTYVQLTRACESTRLYVDQYHSGPDLRHLLSQMAKSQPKQLALEHLPGTRINIRRQPDSSEPMTLGSMESSRDTEKKASLSQPARLPVIVRPSTKINQTEPCMPPKNAVKRKRKRKRRRKQPEQRSPEEVLCTDNTKDPSTQERHVGVSPNLEANQDPSLGEVAEQNALPNDWHAFLTEHGEPVFASFRVLDCSHVQITGTTERAAVEAAIARYGKMPGGIVVEGEARCDFPIRSLAIDPVTPSRLTLNGAHRFNTGLSGEEVALLWHAILQSDHVSQDFGVLSQNEAIGIENENIVALTMMKADNVLGGIVYGYDSEFAIRGPDYSFYRNPFLDEISDVSFAGALPQQCFNYLYERAARCFLRILDVRFVIGTAHTIKVCSTNAQAVIGFSGSNDIDATSVSSNDSPKPTLDDCFPHVHRAFNHFVDNFARYARLEPHLARVIAYAEVVLLLRRAKATNALLLGHDDICKILTRRQQVVLPSFNHSVRSDEFVQKTSDIARYLARRTDANTFDCLASALIGLRFANLAGDFDSFVTCKKAVYDRIVGLSRKAQEPHAPAHHHELRRLFAVALEKISNMSHDILISNCIGDALHPNRTWQQRNASLHAARRLCGTDAMLAKNPATRCLWLEINSHLDPSFNPIPELAQARAEDVSLLIPYIALQRINFARQLDCRRQCTRDEVLKAIAGIKSFAAMPSLAPAEAWATLHNFAEQASLRLARREQSVSPSASRFHTDDQSALHEVIRLCAERLSSLPPTAFLTQLLHRKNPVIASHQLLDVETTDGLKILFAGARNQVEHFSANASERWWHQLLRDLAAPSATDTSKVGLLLAYELRARDLHVGQLYEKMIQHSTKNPQAALLMFDLDTLSSPHT